MTMVAKIPRKHDAPAETRPTAPATRRMTPWSEMESLFERVFEDSRSGFPGRRFWDLPFFAGLEPAEGRLPRVDIVDRDDAVVLKAEVPGVRKEDLEVTLTDDAVTLKGAAGHEEEHEEGELHRHEMVRGEFTRTLSLPAAVDPKTTTARYENGVLELVMPKVTRALRHIIKVA